MTALGTTAPEGSVRVPRTLPALPLWADAEMAARNNARKGRMRKVVPRLSDIRSLQIMAKERGIKLRGKSRSVLFASRHLSVPRSALGKIKEPRPSKGAAGRQNQTENGIGRCASSLREARE